MNEIKIGLSISGIIGADNNVIGFTNENKSTKLVFNIPGELTTKDFYLDIEKPGGSKVKTSKIDIVDNKAEYIVTNAILGSNGYVRIQVILQDADNYVMKYPILVFKINSSIDATAAIEEEQQDFVAATQTVIDLIDTNGDGAKYLSNDGEYKEVSGGTPDYNDLENKPIIQIARFDETNPIVLKDLQTGAYILTGWCTPYTGSDVYMSAQNAVTFVNNFTTVTAIQIFFPPYNQVQYFEIYEDSYTENMVQMNKCENTDNKVTTIDNNSTDTQYPTAKAVKDYVDSLLG